MYEGENLPPPTLCIAKLFAYKPGYGMSRMLIPS